MDIEEFIKGCEAEADSGLYTWQAEKLIEIARHGVKLHRNSNEVLEMGMVIAETVHLNEIMCKKDLIDAVDDYESTISTFPSTEPV